VSLRPAECRARGSSGVGTGDTVREFLKANGVNAADASTDAKASVVRVICVRK